MEYKTKHTQHTTSLRICSVLGLHSNGGRYFDDDDDDDDASKKKITIEGVKRRQHTHEERERHEKCSTHLTI